TCCLQRPMRPATNVYRTNISPVKRASNDPTNCRREADLSLPIRRTWRCLAKQRINFTGRLFRFLLNSDAAEDGDGDGTIGSSRNLPGQLVAFQFIAANLSGAIPSGKRSAIDAETDGVPEGVDRVAPEVDAHIRVGTICGKDFN